MGLNCPHQILLYKNTFLSSSNFFALQYFILCIIPATWGGAKLADVLELVGIPKLSSVTALGGKHVEFVSVDRCKVSMPFFIDQQQSF